jgi:hypothetical protein
MDKKAHRPAASVPADSGRHGSGVRRVAIDLPDVRRWTPPAFGFLLAKLSDVLPRADATAGSRDGRWLPGIGNAGRL